MTTALVLGSALMVPLVLAQGSATNQSGQPDAMRGMQRGMGMMRGSGIAVDDRFIYVMVGGTIGRIDKSSGRTAGTLTLYDGMSSTAQNGTGWDSAGSLDKAWGNLGTMGTGSGTSAGGSGTTAGTTGGRTTGSTDSGLNGVSSGSTSGSSR